MRGAWEIIGDRLRSSEIIGDHRRSSEESAVARTSSRSCTMAGASISWWQQRITPTHEASASASASSACRGEEDGRRERGESA